MPRGASLQVCDLLWNIPEYHWNLTKMCNFFLILTVPTILLGKYVSATVFLAMSVTVSVTGVKGERERLVTPDLTCRWCFGFGLAWVFCHPVLSGK